MKAALFGSVLMLSQMTSVAIAGDGPQQAFKSLIADGFRIVGTTFVPAEAQADKNAVILVTLQLNKAVAVCTFGVGSWETMKKARLEDEPSSCDVRYY